MVSLQPAGRRVGRKRIGKGDQQNTGQNHSIKTGSKSFERMAKFKFLLTTLTNQNCIFEEIKGRLESGNVYHSLVQNLLSSHLLSRHTEA
jgi:predicted dienelactone hydrolase